MTHSELEQLIIQRIQREGPLPFAEYMRMALYEPGYGYYVAGTPKMGWQGDYFTSTDVSTLFANCMGRQLYRMWESLQRPTPFLTLEQGAGRGNLAQGVRAWAEKDAPDFSTALDYRVSDIRTGEDAINLVPTGRTQEEEASDAPVPSVILSNELIDAFPVHIVEMRAGKLYEIYVDTSDGRLVEILDTPSSPAVAEYLDRYSVPWRSFEDGWRAEINLDALSWMARAAQQIERRTGHDHGEPIDSQPASQPDGLRPGLRLRQAARNVSRPYIGGYILTIDYGDKAKALYTRTRRRGTLLCYYQHSVNERPLSHPGEQDITAYVNFSALIDEGRRHGLRLNTYTTQARWLENTGMFNELERRRTSEYAAAMIDRASDSGQVALLKWYTLRQSAATLADPAGMGNFKVLIMRGYAFPTA